MTTVACVLRTGGIYTPAWFWRISRGLLEHMSAPYKLMCLTDSPSLSAAWAIKLEHNWPGWWSKLELFRPGLFEGPVIYLDLDTLVLGDLADIARYRGPFAMLSDFYRPTEAESGVMAWTPGHATDAIWEAFTRDPFRAMQKYRRDGRFIAEHSTPDRLQDRYPGQIVSLKVHCKQGPPAGARLCCGHGKPRFSEPAAGWAHEVWAA